MQGGLVFALEDFLAPVVLLPLPRAPERFVLIGIAKAPSYSNGLEMMWCSGGEFEAFDK